jgi:hypothetical protein
MPIIEPAIRPPLFWGAQALCVLPAAMSDFTEKFKFDSRYPVNYNLPIKANYYQLAFSGIGQLGF